MRKKIYLIIFVLTGILFGCNVVYADEQAIINSYEILLKKDSKSNPALGTYGMDYYSINSKIYEFWDNNNQYNVIYELNDDNTKMGWLVVDTTLKNKVKEIYIEKKLEYFGNALYSNGYLYVVYGDNDDTTTDSSSDDYATSITMEVVKYDTSGNIVADLPLEGKETSRIDIYNTNKTYIGYGTAKPFDSGNCDMAINKDGIIKVVYNREMYNGHTSSHALYIDSNDLTYLNRPSTMDTNNEYYTLNNNYFVSHSFEERVIADNDGEFVSADLGDGNPRAFLLTKPYPGTSSVRQQLSKYEVFHFREGYDSAYGYNNTFASLGNIVEVSDGYILVASSEKTLSLNYAPTSYINESRNIFIQKYSLDLKGKTTGTIQMFNTDPRTSETVRTSVENKGAFYLSSSGVTDYGVKWLTNYANDKTITEVRAVEINDENILIIWSESDLKETSSGYYTSSATRKFYYEIIDKDGNLIQEATAINTATPTLLIDYVYKDGYVYWTDTSNKSSVIINQLNVSKTEELAYINRVGEENITINDGDVTTKQFRVDTNKDVGIEWKSSDTDVATVDENGLVTIIDNGTATITATLKGYSLKTTWNLEVNYLCNSITPSSNEVEVKVGSSKYISVTVNPTNAKVRKLDWKSTNEDIFTISNSYSTGSVTIIGQSIGEANLIGTTTDGSNIEVTIKVKVFNPITSLIFDETSITIQKGNSKQIGYTINPSDASEVIHWSSTDESKLIVDENGIITGVSGGTAYVKASTNYNGIQKTIKVKVESPLTGIGLDRKSVYLQPGDSIKLNKIYYPSDQNDTFSMTYTSSDTSVATVLGNGTVTAKGYGTVTITLTTSNGFSAECIVTVGDYLKGDMNKDGSITITDVIKLLRVYLELEEKISDTLDIGDMNDSGDITITDVIKLLRIYLELE